MKKVLGVYRNGHIELNTPVDWPEKYPVVVSDEMVESGFLKEEDSVDTPEEIARRVRILETFQSMGWTDEEESRIKEAWDWLTQANIEMMKQEMGLAP